MYVAKSVWENGFKDQFLAEVAKIKIGAPQDWTNFLGPVMWVTSFTFFPSCDANGYTSVADLRTTRS